MPGDEWSDFLDGSKDLDRRLGDAQVRQLQHQDRASAAVQADRPCAADDRRRRRAAASASCQSRSRLLHDISFCGPAWRRSALCADARAGSPRADAVDDALEALRRRQLRRHASRAIDDRRPDRPCDGRGRARGPRAGTARSCSRPTGPVYYRDEAGALHDAEDRRSARRLDAAGLKTVRLNNRVRRAVDAALGSLTLLVGGSGEAPRGGAGGVQVARRRRLCRRSTRRSPRRPTAASARRCEAAGRRSSSARPTPPRPTASPPSRCSSSAATGRRGAAALAARRPRRRSSKPRPRPA